MKSNCLKRIWFGRGTLKSQKCSRVEHNHNLGEGGEASRGKGGSGAKKEEQKVTAGKGKLWGWDFLRWEDI